MISASRAICLIACGLACAATASAQGTIRGQAYDSLRAAPLGGALVTVDGANRRAVTDARGRFELRDVPLGPQRVRVMAPRLDSLALGALERAVDVRAGGSDVALATPSLTSYAMAVCGAPLENEQGILLGSAVDAVGDAVGGVHVAALWNETVLATTGATGLVRAAVDTSTDGGFFALCGVPVDAEYRMRAGDDARGSATLAVAASAERVRRRDVRIGSPERTVRLRGRVSDDAGRGLAGIVEVLDDSTVSIRTDSTGNFVVDLPERSAQLWVRVVGYTPRTVDIEGVAPETDFGDVVLDRVPQELPGRLIEGRLVSPSEFEFEERRKTGLGVHIDSAALAKFPVVTVTALASESRIARVVRSGGRGETLMLRKGADFCSPRVFLDGMYLGKTVGRQSVDQNELGHMLRDAKRVEMYTAPYAPPSYPDFDGCGVVLIWTR